ncbi:indolepyruvate ferredoxin oxidoreductase [Sphingomonas laterariae]|uniref:Indolepyruvate ferredoxin oxidoreductase n=1 Tax=Edaphosphingomonas laterariae TaxID=861865 RepID=A0A239C854_9SPHN|nr:indolepyruvate ferredoxin oxidoreductase family protein [Sphingomonas laterariae]SNS16109.1 indolepyruvate ferredoxin oxidoreductase [Sphingomonas laterariae]
MRTIALDDKYTANNGRIYVTGSQALARLPMMQRARDEAAGLNTAGYISGYRGSPLGIYDLALWQAADHLKRHHVHFQPGTNEDLAATAVWGTQHVGLPGSDARYDGVFAIWYGKGPGVDRSGDPIKHGNYAGTNPHGGVLLLCGDDHAARSSTVAHQSEHALMHFGMPVLNPASIQDYLDLGLMGFALSRYSGCWVGFKCVTDTVDGSASVSVDPERVRIALPTDFAMPQGGLGMRAGVPPLQAERTLYELRHAAAQAFARANRLDDVAFGRREGPVRLGIATAGKSFLDVIEALGRLGIDEARAHDLGIAVFKIAMVYPLEPEGLTAFAGRCEELLVVEEKRPVLEDQIARLIVNLASGRRPRLTGKQDEQGRPLIASVGELEPDAIARVIAGRYLAMAPDASLATRLDVLGQREVPAPGAPATLTRLPSFCAGCPHNSSTRVPEGSKAMGGIGCHGLAVWMPERRTSTISHMGGEGAMWLGQEPFVNTPHMFQNLGDGTYFHSGLLAIRACVAAKANITYKILLNGAIAMTGGQPIEGEHFEGELTAPHVAAQLDAEGVGRIALVSDDPARHKGGVGFPASVSFHHRDDLDAVQRELREIPGVTAIIYDQSCATERRRLRKRGKVADPNERLFIHPDVCEGCGDCGVQSNCVALEPVETEFGRKRRINQSVCNKDYSCVKGMCPSFVSVIGGKLRTYGGAAEAFSADHLPEPAIPPIERTLGILIAGIGGNGVVTVGALLGTAAHMEGKPATVLDISGLAQRNGPVTSHVRFASADEAGHAARIPQGGTDLLLACDLVAASNPENLSKLDPERTAAVFNRFVAPTSAFAGNPDLDFGHDGLERMVGERSRDRFGIDATGLAQRLLGDAIGANMLLVGYAWQKGLVPLSRASIEAAIRLNGTQVALNLNAFALGRIMAAEPDSIADLLVPADRPVTADLAPAAALDAMVARRTEHLTAYQDAAYAARYRALVDRVRRAEEAVGTGKYALTEAVARNHAKLMAYKDEYEVARLFSSGLRRHLEGQFEGDYRLQFHLAPPLFARRDKATGRYRKIRFGPWMGRAFGLLARLKFLRGTPLDLFGYSHHRRIERQLIGDYEALVDELIATLSPANHKAAVDLASVADKVRGFDVVKDAAVRAMQDETELRRAEFAKIGEVEESREMTCSTM